MLTKLTIKNFALIDDLEIGFGKGLTTITGETGAGKSIILTAVSLLTGNRADLSMVRDEKRKCIIEAEFDLSRQQVRSYFEEHDFEYSDHTIIRREFSRDGKSRVFVNDSPAVLLHLKSIVNRLLDVHSQHENLELNKRVYQLDAIDTYGGLMEHREEYRRQFEKYKQASIELKELEEKSRSMRENADYISFQLNELLDADLRMGEQEELEEELDTLSHSEEIKLNLEQVQNILNKEEGSISEELNEILHLVRKTSNHLQGMVELGQRMESLVIELDDIQRELDKFSESTDLDPERLLAVQDRLSMIYQLQQKHRLSGVQELIQLKDKLGADFEQISNIDDYIEAARKKRDMSLSSLEKMAESLSSKRSEAALLFSQEVSERLRRLGMMHTRFEVKAEVLEEFTINGRDSIEFLFSANEGIPVKAVSKVASGGELSRLMLSIKAALAQKAQLATVIFDEIDTGISGEVADKMGKIILEMSEGTQLLTITHLPQIAAKGQRQMKVFKEGEKGNTQTRIKELSEEQRVQEIARLLSGEDISAEAVQNARVLLGKLK